MGKNKKSYLNDISFVAKRQMMGGQYAANIGKVWKWGLGWVWKDNKQVERSKASQSEGCNSIRKDMEQQICFCLVVVFLSIY